MKRPAYVRNASKAAGRVIVAVATGQGVFVSEKMRADRVATCERCVHFIAQFRQCEVCGCFVDAKSRLQTESCPRHKWAITSQ